MIRIWYVSPADLVQTAVRQAKHYVSRPVILALGMVLIARIVFDIWRFWSVETPRK